MADKIVVLRDGLIEQIGKPLDLYHHPRTEFVAGFLGSPSMNFLDVSNSNGAIVIGQTTLKNYSGSAHIVRCGIRPEHIKPSKTDSDGLEARIVVKESLGGEAFLYCKLLEIDADIVVKTDGEDNFSVDDVINLHIPPTRVHLFDTDGLSEESL